MLDERTPFDDRGIGIITVRDNGETERRRFPGPPGPSYGSLDEAA